MSTEPRQSQGTTGVIHIDSQHPSFGQSRASEFLVSFGGKKDGMGAFYIGRAFGLDDLVGLLVKIGVSQSDVDAALEVLQGQPKHEIPNVTLPKAFLRNLGL